MNFIEAIRSENIENIRQFPKSDLHNHFVLGGNREYIFKKTGHYIKPISHPLKSMNEMDAWSNKYIGNYFNSTDFHCFFAKISFITENFYYSDFRIPQ